MQSVGLPKISSLEDLFQAIVLNTSEDCCWNLCRWLILSLRYFLIKEKLYQFGLISKNKRIHVSN